MAGNINIKPYLPNDNAHYGIRYEYFLNRDHQIVLEQLFKNDDSPARTKQPKQYHF